MLRHRKLCNWRSGATTLPLGPWQISISRRMWSRVISACATSRGCVAHSSCSSGSQRSPSFYVAWWCRRVLQSRRLALPRSARARHASSPRHVSPAPSSSKAARRCFMVSPRRTLTWPRRTGATHRPGRPSCWRARCNLGWPSARGYRAPMAACGGPRSRRMVHRSPRPTTGPPRSGTRERIGGCSRCLTAASLPGCLCSRRDEARHRRSDERQDLGRRQRSAPPQSHGRPESAGLLPRRVSSLDVGTDG